MIGVERLPFWYRIKKVFESGSKRDGDRVVLERIGAATTYQEASAAYHQTVNGDIRELGRSKAVDLARKPGDLLYDVYFDAPPNSPSRISSLERLVSMVNYQEEASYLKDQLSFVEDPQELEILSQLETRTFKTSEGKIDWNRWIDNGQ